MPGKNIAMGYSDYRLELCRRPHTGSRTHSATGSGRNETAGRILPVSVPFPFRFSFCGRLSVSMSVTTHKSVFYQNGGANLNMIFVVFGMGASSHLSDTVLQRN